MHLCFPRIRIGLPSFPRTRIRAFPNFRIPRLAARRTAREPGTRRHTTREPGTRRHTITRTATVAWKRATRMMRRESRVPAGFDIICTPASSAPASRQNFAEDDEE